MTTEEEKEKEEKQNLILFINSTAVDNPQWFFITVHHYKLHQSFSMVMRMRENERQREEKKTHAQNVNVPMKCFVNIDTLNRDIRRVCVCII